MSNLSAWLLVTVVVAQAPQSATIRWTSDLEGALALAKQHRVPVLVHFTSDHCPPCRALEKGAFKNESVVEAIHSDYIPVLINVDHDKEIAHKYRVMQWPTDVLLGADGQVIHSGVSPQDPKKYVGTLASGLKRHEELLAMGNVRRTTNDRRATVDAGRIHVDPRERSPFFSRVENPADTSVASVPTAPNFMDGTPSSLNRSRQAVAPVVPANMPQANPLFQRGGEVATVAPEVPSIPSFVENSELADRRNSSRENSRLGSDRAETQENPWASRKREQSNAPATVENRFALSDSDSGSSDAVNRGKPQMGGTSSVGNPFFAAGYRGDSSPRNTAQENVREPIESTIAGDRDSDRSPIGNSPTFIKQAPALPAFSVQENSVAQAPESEPVAAEVKPEPQTQLSTLSPVDPDVILDGFCPVTLQQQMEAGHPELAWQQGDQRFAVRHRSKIYYLKDQAAVDLFMADPDKFAAVLAGNDVVTFLVEGKLVPGTRDSGFFLDGRLFLFSSEKTKEAFGARPDYYTTALDRLVQLSEKASRTSQQ